ncbi:MAG: tetratricopeptide repeat protein [Pseudomonadota bacterium]
MLNLAHRIFFIFVTLVFFDTGFLYPQEAPKALFEKAESLFNNKKFSESLTLYQKIVTADPSFVQAYRGVVSCYGELGNPQGAVKFMDSLFIEHPQSAELHYGLGYALYSAGKYEDAGNYFDKALQLKPDLAAAWNNRAAIYHFITRDYKRARQYYEKAIEISSRAGNTWVLDVAKKNLANLPAEEDVKPLTLEAFLNTFIARADANDAQGVRQLVLGQKKNGEQALEWFLNQAMMAYAEDKKDEEKTTVALATLLVTEYAAVYKSDSLRKRLQAYTGMDDAKKKKMAGGETLLNAGMEKEQQGLYEDAGRKYKEALACFESMGDKSKAGLIFLYLGDVGRAVKRYPEARKAYSDALTCFLEIKDERQKALALSSLGITCSLLGEQSDALDFLRRSLNIYAVLKDEEALKKVKDAMALIEVQINEGKGH